MHQILSKFPLDVVLKLEDRKKVGDAWTMELLRQLLNQYIEVQESAQRHVASAKGHSQVFRSQRQSERQYISRYSSENWQTNDTTLPLVEMYFL